MAIGASQLDQLGKHRVEYTLLRPDRQRPAVPPGRADPRPHLAIVTPYPPSVTGIGQYGYHLSRALARSGAFARVTVLTEQRPEQPGGAAPERFDDAQRAPAREPALPNLNERDDGLPLTIARTWRPGSLASGAQVTRRLLALQPDVVWFNLGASVFGRSPLANLSGLFSPAVARRAGLPAVITLHETVAQVDLRRLQAPGGPLAAVGARLLTRLGVQADVVCVTLQRQADWLRQHHPGLRLAHIPHGVYDPPEWLPAPAGPAGAEVLMFTTHAPFKGLETLLAAFTRLQGRYPALRLTLAGSEHPRYPGYLRRVQAEFGARPGVRWLGCLPEEQLRQVFAQAALVVLPYTATTGSSSVLFRAATWGRPALCSDLPELRAAAGEAGLEVDFFPAGQVDGLAAALDRLLAHPERRQAQARHNFAAVSAGSIEATCDAYLQAFAWAAQAHPQRHPWWLAGPRQEAA